MKIPLSQGKFTIVGPKDYAYLMQWKWYYNVGYAARTDRTSGQRTIWMHRVILKRMSFKDFAQTDHKDRDGLNNCRYNLRPATVSQNQCNANKPKNNTSGYKGISWHKQDRKWRARIQTNRKPIYLGCYDNLKEAADVYNEAACKYHGEFAVLNRV
jgi:hypothetical protein